MRNNKGITLVTVVVIIIVIIIIATTSIISGNKLILNSRNLTNEQIVESVKEAVYRRKTELALQGTITPKGDSFPGTVNPLIGDGTMNANGWYALDKNDLADLGVKDVEARFLVNYKYNDAISMADPEYVEKFFVSSFLHKVDDGVRSGTIPAYIGTALSNKTSEEDTTYKMYEDNTEQSPEYYGTNWFVVEPSSVTDTLEEDFEGIDITKQVTNDYLINYKDAKYVKITSKFKPIGL